MILKGKLKMKIKDINNKEYEIPISAIDGIQKIYSGTKNKVAEAILTIDDKKLRVNRKTWKKVQKEFDRENEVIIGIYEGVFHKLKVAVLINNICELIAKPKNRYAIKYISIESKDEQTCFITKDQYEYLQKRLNFSNEEKNDE